MPHGSSGRIVIEIKPDVKRRLYSALALSGSTLKDWFLKAATEFCEDALQPSLFPKEHRDETPESQPPAKAPKKKPH